jgi:hypothetical protein
VSKAARDYIYGEAFALAREAAAAGLVVTRIDPHQCGGEYEYSVALWMPDGTLWAEGTHETADMVRRHIDGYIRSAGVQIHEQHGIQHHGGYIMGPAPRPKRVYDPGVAVHRREVRKYPDGSMLVSGWEPETILPRAVPGILAGEIRSLVAEAGETSIGYADLARRAVQCRLAHDEDEARTIIDAMVSERLLLRRGGSRGRVYPAPEDPASP